MELRAYLILFIIFIVCSTASAVPVVHRNKHRGKPIPTVNHQEKVTLTALAVKTPVKPPVNAPVHTPIKPPARRKKPYESEDHRPCYYGKRC
ncbi:hypothetical protein C2G38_2076193 [Gigaspora rosea]|uniref:Uncharacterized protein n=1 Tax=Gigaspora rosea TaxID=44941 RepID=A0A397VJJ8_9GLOM|nr:hypothetical protein C2G38_2076193 [Gigaspora rosea]